MGCRTRGLKIRVSVVQPRRKAPTDARSASRRSRRSIPPLATKHSKAPMGPFVFVERANSQVRLTRIGVGRSSPFGQLRCPDSVDSSLRSSPLRGAYGVQIGKADLSRIGPPLATISNQQVRSNPTGLYCFKNVPGAHLVPLRVGTNRGSAS